MTAGTSSSTRYDDTSGDLVRADVRAQSSAFAIVATETHVVGGSDQRDLP
jgi:hypothetical protein